MIGAAAARNFGAVFQSVDHDAGFMDELEPGDDYRTEPEAEPEMNHVVFGGVIHQVTDDTLMYTSRKKLKKFFRLIDSDGNNYLDREEFRDAVESSVSVGISYGCNVRNQLQLTDEEFHKLFEMVNDSDDGVVDFKELWEFLKPLNIRKPENFAKHGDMYNQFKYTFLRAMSRNNQKPEDPQSVAGRFKLRFKVSIPPRELREFESKLIGGINGFGLYVGRDMPSSAAQVPVGSILFSVSGKVMDNMKSQDCRNVISFTDDNENCNCVFKNQSSLTVSQQKNIPKEAWIVLSQDARDQLMMDEEREFETLDDKPFVQEIYPPGHNRHTPDKRKRPMAYRLHRTMEDETYSSLSFLIAIVVMLMILLSTIAYIMETIPPLEDKTVVWDSIESSVSIAFTVEYILRIIACKSKWVYFWDGLNLVDFLAFLPFWIKIAFGSEGSAQLRVIRVIRLARVIRLMKSPAFSTYLTVLEQTTRSSISSLGLLITIIMLEVIVCASLAYVAERGNPMTVGVCNDWTTNETELTCTGGVRHNFMTQYSNEDCLLECVDSATAGCCEFDQSYLSCIMYNEDPEETFTQDGDILSEITPSKYSAMCHTEEKVVRKDELVSPFCSIPNAMWWCVVTMTTVGYGDMYPIEVSGQLIGIFTMFSGLLVIALPVIIIGKDFDNANTAQLRKNNRKQSSLNALARLKNDRKGTVEEFFKEVNDFFKTQFNKQEEAGTSSYEYQAVTFSHDDESSFYEAGFTSKHQIESILRCKRGFVYLPNYLHIPPPHANGYRSIPKYSSFSLWHIYGQLLRKGKAKRKQILPPYGH